jgi:FdhD protein
MDKVIGRALLDGLRAAPRPPALRLRPAVVRARAEGAVAGAPVLVGVGAPSSLAVSLAEDRGMTLCGFARGGRVNVYTGAQRVSG